jgi:nitrogen-specific signal transduction histidine kinase
MCEWPDLHDLRRIRRRDRTTMSVYYHDQYVKSRIDLSPMKGLNLKQDYDKSMPTLYYKHEQITTAFKRTL